MSGGLCDIPGISCDSTSQTMTVDSSLATVGDDFGVALAVPSNIIHLVVDPGARTTVGNNFLELADLSSIQDVTFPEYADES